MPRPATEPEISDYAIIGDCHSAALVSRSGSIDWCCLPRFDSASCFARLLDPGAGSWSLCPTADHSHERRYVDDTLVLETTFRTSDGVVLVRDCFAMRRGGRERPLRQLLRIVEGVEGELEMDTCLAARLAYGSVRPWIRDHRERGWTVLGGDQGLHVTGDVPWERWGDHDLHATFTVAAGQRRRLAMAFVRPELADPRPDAVPDVTSLDERLTDTERWWRHWSGRADLGQASDDTDVLRSAITLKALSYAPTGAIAAAATTSLPESMEGGRNWDYRYSWIRDSVWTARALVALGYEDVADGFRRFVERSAAGSPDDLQVLFGIGGERRLFERELPELRGFAGVGPVRMGNAAEDQEQHDVYGELLDLAWTWASRGHEPDDDYWRFVVQLADAAAGCWTRPDRGIWEWRGAPRHFVHSKVACWVALDRAVRLASETGRPAPVERWRTTQHEIRDDVHRHGVDPERGCFVQSYGSRALDAALLRLPLVGFADFDDPRVAATVDAVLEDLSDDGFVWRYREEDGLAGSEGAFLACSFWLVECLAGLGRDEEAEAVFRAAAGAANDVGLFSEEFDPFGGHALGNVPQALTHLSHAAAAQVLATRRHGVR